MITYKNNTDFVLVISMSQWNIRISSCTNLKLLYLTKMTNKIYDIFIYLLSP